MNSHIKSFYYQILNSDADTLIIGIGGGQDILNAYVNGIKRITAVEINPVIAKLNTDLFKKFNGDLFNRANVTLHIDEGRSFIRILEKSMTASIWAMWPGCRVWQSGMKLLHICSL